MKKNSFLIIIIIIVGALAAALFVLVPSQNHKKESEKIEVAATIFPIQAIAQEIGGEELVDVKLLLPAGASPHIYEPTASKVAEVEGVDIIFAIGHGLDEWVYEMFENNEGVEVVVVDKDIELKKFSQDDGSEGLEDELHEHKHTGELNPHYWLSVTNAKKIAKTIYDELSESNTENQNIYKENLDVFDRKMDELAAEIESEMISLPNKNLITFHNSWPYYAEEFGLKISGVIELVPGVAPTPKYLVELEKTITKNKIKTVYAEPQLSTESIKGFLDDLDVEIKTLDPIGGEGDNLSYEALLRNNALTIQRGGE